MKCYFILALIFVIGCVAGGILGSTMTRIRRNVQGLCPLCGGNFVNVFGAICCERQDCEYVSYASSEEPK